MEWLKLTVTTAAAAEEMVSNVLIEAGAQGIQVDDASTGAQLPADQAAVTGFFAEDQALSEIAPLVLQNVRDLKQYGFATDTATISDGSVDDTAWSSAWEKYYHPVRITRYLSVVPRWEKQPAAAPGEIQLIMDPGRAFGTGTHPSTHLTLGLLEGCIRGGERVLDVGTGSGILAIAAMRMGAESVLATDLEDDAVESAKQNIALNPVDHIEVISSDLLTNVPADAKYSLVLANMLPVVLVPLIPQVPAHMLPGANLLLAGIISEKAALIKQTLQDNGFVIAEEHRLGDWVAFRAQLAEED